MKQTKKKSKTLGTERVINMFGKIKTNILKIFKELKIVFNT